VSVWLFTLKLNDLIVERREGDIATQFNAMEKVRHQGFGMAWSSAMLMSAVSSINNMGEPTAQALNMLTLLSYAGLGIIVDAVFTFWRRKRLPGLIERARTKRRRSTDVPHVPPTP
jgi:hypothetical protein